MCVCVGGGGLREREREKEKNETYENVTIRLAVSGNWFQEEDLGIKKNDVYNIWCG